MDQCSVVSIQIAQVYSNRFGNHLRAGTFLIVLLSALSGFGLLRTRRKAEEFGTDQTAVFTLEVSRKLLDKGIVRHFALVVMGRS